MATKAARSRLQLWICGGGGNAWYGRHANLLFVNPAEAQQSFIVVRGVLINLD